jgi:tetratricopeptide (TPR) repeat protein
VNRQRLVVVSLVIVVAGSVVLFGRGGTPGRPVAASAPAPPVDVAVLVEQLAARSSEDVVQRLERQAARRPEDADLLALLGIAYQQRFREMGDPTWLTRAETALRRSRAVAPTTTALTGLAQLSVTQHRFESAIQLARLALREQPHDAGALGALADALVNTGRYREAHRVIDRLAGLGPSVAAYARVGFARWALGRRGEAVVALELALEAGSGIPEQEAWVRVQLGTMLLVLGRLDRAAAAFAQALDDVPGYVHARAGLARVAAARGRFPAAARQLRRVVARLPSPAYAIQLGDVLARDGRRAEARRAYALVSAIEQLLRANGVRTDLQTALFDLDHGRRPGAALDRAREAYRRAPSVEAADVVAWGLARTGRCAEARSWSQRALRLGTKDGLFFFHRGMIERCLGTREAATWFRRALDADPSFSHRWAPVAERLAA